MRMPESGRPGNGGGDSRPAVFLVDDHPMVRQGLAQFLTASGFLISGQAGGSAETLAHPGLPRSAVAIVDLSLAGESGIDLARRLSGLGIRVVVYSMHEESQVIRRALEAGVLGYVTKREPPQQLLEAVRAALAGTSHHGPRVREILSYAHPEDFLSDQQRRIFEFLGDGFSNEEIARELGIGRRTLESYCARIMDKLGIEGLKELRRRAIRSARSALPDDPRIP